MHVSGVGGEWSSFGVNKQNRASVLFAVDPVPLFTIGSPKIPKAGPVKQGLIVRSNFALRNARLYMQ